MKGHASVESPLTAVPPFLGVSLSLMTFLFSRVKYYSTVLSLIMWSTCFIAATFSFLIFLSATHSLVLLLKHFMTLAKFPAPMIWPSSKSSILILFSSVWGLKSYPISLLLLMQDKESAAVLDSQKRGLLVIGTPVIGSLRKCKASMLFIYLVVLTLSLLNLDLVGDLLVLRFGLASAAFAAPSIRFITDFSFCLLFESVKAYCLSLLCSVCACYLSPSMLPLF